MPKEGEGEGLRSPTLWANMLSSAFSDLRQAILDGDEKAMHTAQNRVVVIVLAAAAAGAGGLLLT